MGYKEAIIGGIIGLIIGLISLNFILSTIGDNLSETSKATWMLFVPVVFSISGVKIGYEYKG